MEGTTLLPVLEVTNPNSSVIPVISEYYSDEDYHAVLGRRLNILSMVICSLTFVLGVTGNGLVIFITGFRMKRTVNTIWFLNLAIADFTFTLFLPLYVAYGALNLHWPFGEATCKFHSSLVFINLYTSAFLLAVISIDRCISVRCPGWARNHRTPRLASFVSLGSWILALVLSFPYIHFGQTAWLRNGIHCYTHFSPHIYHTVVISRFTFAFAIPFTVIFVCYTAIVLRLKRDRLAPLSNPFKVSTAVTVAFFICWLPFHIFSFIGTQAHDDLTLRLPLLIGSPLVSSLAFLNSCLNPILYFFMGLNFKERLRHSFLLTFEDAFSEEVTRSTTRTETTELDSRPL